MPFGFEGLCAELTGKKFISNYFLKLIFSNN
jgi:hypothetical protein